jgi:hypothetical protein
MMNGDNIICTPSLGPSPQTEVARRFSGGKDVEVFNTEQARSHRQPNLAKYRRSTQVSSGSWRGEFA